MSKAEERALEKYPKKIEWVGNQWDGAPFDVNSESRVAYKQGYEQAEKDLELTVDDIKNIDRLLNQCVDCSNPYQEVLKRFNTQKGK
jgi:hypothetical protein